MSAWFYTISWHSGALRLAAVLVRVAVVLVRVAVVLVRVAVVLVRVAAVLFRVYPGLFRVGPGQSLVIRVGAVFISCHCRVHPRSYRVRPWTYRVSTGVAVARRPSMLESPKVSTDHPGSWSGAVRGSPGPPYSSVLLWDCSYNISLHSNSLRNNVSRPIYFNKISVETDMGGGGGKVYWNICIFIILQSSTVKFCRMKYLR